mmetsp:Transcript_6605/g.15156  ORF Transcript_6605/g.15156 Transcript_6605/m.15156 type:complete len:217 (+) Transcript_6605:1097-1747(+)
MGDCLVDGVEGLDADHVDDRGCEPHDRVVHVEEVARLREPGEARDVEELFRPKVAASDVPLQVERAEHHTEGYQQKGPGHHEAQQVARGALVVGVDELGLPSGRGRDEVARELGAEVLLVRHAQGAPRNSPLEAPALPELDEEHAPAHHEEGEEGQRRVVVQGVPVREPMEVDEGAHDRGHDEPHGEEVHPREVVGYVRPKVVVYRPDRHEQTEAG